MYGVRDKERKLCGESQSKCQRNREKNEFVVQRVPESFWDEKTSDVLPVNPIGTPVSITSPTPITHPAEKRRRQRLLLAPSGISNELRFTSGTRISSVLAV